ncbi:MAG TPA: hypothetical protein VFX68_06990 [Sulfuricurvum sp.]|nr:hypothetical protein [Sulfuricurvum sp.]
MKTILLSVCVAAVLNATSPEPQSILSEVGKLRQKYEECRAGQSIVQGIQPKVLEECNRKNRALSQEIAQKTGVIKSLELTLTSRDRVYRETAARNKTLISQKHTEQVSVQEREMLKRALVNAKNELAVVQKELKKAGGVKIVYKDRGVIQEKIVEKVVYKDQPPVNSKVIEKVVYRDRPIIQEKIVEKIIYRDRPAEKGKVVEKVVYKDRPVIQEKIVEKVVYRDRPIAKEKVIERIVYKDRPVVTEKVVYKDRIVEKVVYKDRPVVQEKIVEKVVYKDRPIVKEKIVEKIVYKEIQPPKTTLKTVVKAEKIIPVPLKQQPKKLTVSDDQKRRLADKLALEAERKKAPVTVTKKGSPSAYRMASDAPIYNAINGEKIDTWESGRSFTSGTSSVGWVKITGYFVNRVWQKADADLWVKESDVIRR